MGRPMTARRGNSAGVEQRPQAGPRGRSSLPHGPHFNRRSATATPPTSSLPPAAGLRHREPRAAPRLGPLRLGSDTSQFHRRHYINVQTADEDETRMQAACPDSLDRLRNVKTMYDPDDLFRIDGRGLGRGPMTVKTRREGSSRPGPLR
jgi:hypothetical protein